MVNLGKVETKQGRLFLIVHLVLFSVRLRISCLKSGTEVFNFLNAAAKV